MDRAGAASPRGAAFLHFRFACIVKSQEQSLGRTMSNEEPEPILWINPREMLAISRKVGAHLAGCHFELVNMSAENNGVLSESDAVLILSDAPEMDMERAQKNVNELIDAGLITREGSTLTLTVFGTAVVPDYDDWEAKD